MANRIKVSREIYEWAIKESQKNFEEILAKFHDIDKWVQGQSYPTFRQLEKLAHYLKVPFGYMFLDTPPETSIIESEFRTIGNKTPNISKNLKDTIYDMSRKLNWISEYRKENEWDKIIPNEFAKLDLNNHVEFSKKAKEFLLLDEFWYRNFSDNRLAFNFLREKIESIGIIVMQNGIVGTNTHRKLDINEFRGFMLYDDLAPLIFINSNDSQAGKIFTLIHEYIHILLEEDDIFKNLDLNTIDDVEKKINRISAEFLMPKTHIDDCWNFNALNLKQIEDVSRLFNVSKIALAIRLRELKYINESLVEEVIEATKEALINKKDTSNGGDYWNNYFSRYSKAYMETVIQGAESGDISFDYAFKLLDVKAKSYDLLKESVSNYE